MVVVMPLASNNGRPVLDLAAVPGTGRGDGDQGTLRGDQSPRLWAIALCRIRWSRGEGSVA